LEPAGERKRYNWQQQGLATSKGQCGPHKTHRLLTAEMAEQPLGRKRCNFQNIEAKELEH